MGLNYKYSWLLALEKSGRIDNVFLGGNVLVDYFFGILLHSAAYHKWIACVGLLYCSMKIW